MTGVQIFTLTVLVVITLALVYVAVEYLLAQERRHAEWRADIDAAIALTKERHPSGEQIPAEDRDDWPPA